MKMCNKCNIQKYKKDFYKNNAKKDGLQSHCKQCTKEIDKGRVLSGENKIRCKDKYDKYLGDEKYQKKELQRKRKWLKENIELHREINRMDYQKNKTAYIVRNSKRRNKMNKLESEFTEQNWQECLKHFEYSCAYCDSKGKLTREHLVPVAKDGGFTKNNIIPACPFCNSSKRDTDFLKWYTRQEFYSKKREIAIINYLSNVNCGAKHG